MKTCNELVTLFKRIMKWFTVRWNFSQRNSSGINSHVSFSYIGCQTCWESPVCTDIYINSLEIDSFLINICSKVTVTNSYEIWIVDCSQVPLFARLVKESVSQRSTQSFLRHIANMWFLLQFMLNWPYSCRQRNLNDHDFSTTQYQSRGLVQAVLWVENTTQRTLRLS